MAAAKVVGDIEDPSETSKPLLSPPPPETAPPPPPATAPPPAAAGGGGRNPVFNITATLANLLPTGTLLVFQILSPIFTNLGRCDVVFQACTWGLIAVCSFSCVVLSFTDSFVDEDGEMKYIFATYEGMWVIDGSPEPPPAVALKYRVRFIDFAHAFMTLSIFLAVVVLDQRLVLCLYPEASSYFILAIKLIPLCVALFCCVLFIVFPANRHGIGFPITANF